LIRPKRSSVVGERREFQGDFEDGWRGKGEGDGDVEATAIGLHEGEAKAGVA
jgi:hypothetical protein